ncbi:glycoside hydrolase family 3 protein [Anaerosporobacter faecicola]|uniref:glycoside hydrolase family 3 protein n=1 Tax=Anaerosporobacter faecicola TaxID=2718714 RepID=UPI00143A65D8|nr:glycoside hydrolase family 3 protein [Anaerosporobacter faecicola]
MDKWQRVTYLPNLPLGEKGERVTACKEHIERSKEAAKEGMVLLKNEQQILPLKKNSKVALFGKGTFDYVKGGGGSGDVVVAYTTNLYEGFASLSNHVQVFDELADYYKGYVDEQYKKGILPGLLVEPELSDALCERARNYTDVAIVTICRFSGEDWDRKSTYDPVEEKEDDENKNIFEDGDFYLSHAEKAMIDKVKQYFTNIVVVLNVGGMVDTCWFKDDAAMKAVLMAWQGGIEGGKATAEVLCGITNPSGKLADTFAKTLEDYPSSEHFHESKQYVDYLEDVYVGYRYFETIPEAYDKVNYEFGYGLSYTTFQYNVRNFEEQNGSFLVEVTVTNTGKIPGKEVIQLYVAPPQGLLGKPKKNLIAFQKTRLLQCGETQTVFLTFDRKDLASFDDLGKIQKSAYVLEKGSYQFYVGTSVRNVILIPKNVSITENEVVAQLHSYLAPTSLKKRMLADGSYEELPTGNANDPDYNELVPMKKKSTDGLTPATRAREGFLCWQSAYKEGIHPFIEVAEGKVSLDDFIDQLTNEDLAHLLGGQPNTGLANTFGFGNIPEYGVPNVMTADGPAGLRVTKESGVKTTAWPCATAIACSWNEELAYLVGEAGAKEVKENNIGIWLTPAVNIHRSPLCGRNFEYYSEDPYLTGKMASAMVQGIQSQHIAATVKHFALNNKETNRKDSDSRVSERAAREIYLKAFEMIVKEADPWCIMTSYNIINGHRASEDVDLLEGILRGEWNFKGMVTTDWWTFGEHYKEVKAGNDIKMGCGFPERLLEALDKGILTREEMLQCGKRILELLLKID